MIKLFERWATRMGFDLTKGNDGRYCWADTRDAYRGFCAGWKACNRNK